MNTYSDFLHIEFDDNNILSSLFGIDDANLRMIEKFNKVKIDYRGNQVKIAGNKVSIEKTKKTLLNLFEEAKKGIEIDEEKIKDIKSLLSLNESDSSKPNLFIQTKKRKIIPRSNNQKKYFKLLNEKNIIFAIGPAGTGKTFLAVAKAVAALQSGPLADLGSVVSGLGGKVEYLPVLVSDKSVVDTEINSLMVQKNN